MQPPDTITSLGERLSPEEFGAEFLRAWALTERAFRKLECWQTYQEPATKSLRTFLGGDHEGVEELLESEAEQDAFVYRDVARRKIDYARIRLVQVPLTPYLQWEILNYEVRARQGESIWVVEVDQARELPNEDYFDFLLFDRTVALVHDYGRDGLQAGGWVVREPEALEDLAGRADALRRRAVPLADFARKVKSVGLTSRR